MVSGFVYAIDSCTAQQGPPRRHRLAESFGAHVVFHGMARMQTAQIAPLLCVEGQDMVGVSWFALPPSLGERTTQSASVYCMFGKKREIIDNIPSAGTSSQYPQK